MGPASFGRRSLAVEFIGHHDHHDFQKVFHRIDLGLDVLPYNGHTTSLDSYWMGVPVVTLVGKTVVGRAGLSQLNNLGLTELVAFNEADFVRIAVGLANDLPRLSELRRTLRRRMQNSPLMDAPKFARDVENIYRQVWREWVAFACSWLIACSSNFPKPSDRRSSGWSSPGELQSTARKLRN